MPVHALDHHQDGLNFPIKPKNGGSNFKVASKLCIFLYETTGVSQGMGVMHSGVMDTVFHSG